MIRIESIADVPRANLCTSCGGCVGICPSDALSMAPTPQGTLAPQLDASKCTECGLCLEVCPGHEMDIPRFARLIFSKLPARPEIGNFLQTYAGYATDDEIRWKSQSGGLISALLIYLLESGKIDGAVVTRWSRQDPLTPETHIARTREEILEAVGSKYCPVPAAAAMKRILAENGKFAFVGVPCQIHTVRKAAELRPELKEKVVTHFGLHCLGVFNTRFFDFILGKYGIAGEDVKRFAFRSKEWRGWPCDMRIETHSGRVVDIPGVKSRLMPRPYFTPWRCALCMDKLNELSDISFGDCRIARVYGRQKLKDAAYGDNPGQSDIICRTSTGKSILEAALAADIIRVQPTGWKEVLRTTKVSEKKLALLNLRIFSSIFQMSIPNYGVTYYPKSRTNRFLFLILHAPSMISAFHSFLFDRLARHRRFRGLLQLCPLGVLGVMVVLRERITNYHLFCRSELVAVYNPTDRDATPDS